MQVTRGGTEVFLPLFGRGLYSVSVCFANTLRQFAQDFVCVITQEVKSIVKGYIIQRMRYRNREKEEPASALRAARRSLRNRCPERSQCAILPERCCTPVIREMGFGRVCQSQNRHNFPAVNLL